MDTPKTSHLHAYQNCAHKHQTGEAENGVVDKSNTYIVSIYLLVVHIFRVMKLCELPQEVLMRRICREARAEVSSIEHTRSGIVSKRWFIARIFVVRAILRERGIIDFSFCVHVKEEGASFGLHFVYTIKLYEACVRKLLGSILGM